MTAPAQRHGEKGRRLPLMASFRTIGSGSVERQAIQSPIPSRINSVSQDSEPKKPVCNRRIRAGSSCMPETSPLENKVVFS